MLDRPFAGLVDRHSNPEEVCLQCGIYFREKCVVRQLMNRNCFYLRDKRNAAQSDLAGNATHLVELGTIEPKDHLIRSVVRHFCGSRATFLLRR